MNIRRLHITFRVLLLILSACPVPNAIAQARLFTVVIDPGHGGKDPGALGKYAQEKDINLTVALKLGNLIRGNCPDVKVMFTRETDIFLPLDDRPAIANTAKADLFISVHTNSIGQPKSLRGASTWTLGLARSAANLEVAKRENAVILYESDYKTRYAGFDPTSSESYIIFEFMQDKYMSQSVHFADLIQKQFKHTCNRVDYGVHQAEFLVLRRTAMPSVLIELGFISNLEEERFLSSDAGAATMAHGIYQAFLAYKKENDLRYSTQPAGQVTKQSAHPVESVSVVPPSKPAATPAVTPAATPPASTESNEEPVFMVQIFTANRILPPSDKRLMGLQDVGYYLEGGLYKYTCGGTTADYNEAVHKKNNLLAIFKDAFVVAFKNGKKINVNQAMEEFKTNRNK